MSAPTCRVCSRTLDPGEDAWAEDWHVVTPDGVKIAVRYVCDDCAGPEPAPHGDQCPDPCDHDAECDHGRSWMRHEHCAECGVTR